MDEPRRLGNDATTGGKPWLLLLKMAVAALVLWGLWHTVGQARGEFAERGLEWNDFQMPWLMASAALYFLAQVPAAMFWRAVLIRLGVATCPYSAFRAFFVGHVGKYVPSKLLVVALRAGLISRDRIDLQLAATSVFFETLTTMAVGAAVACAILVTLPGGTWHVRALAAGLLLICLVGSFPATFRWGFRTFLSRRGGGLLVEATRRLDFRTIAFGWGCGVATWLLAGASTYAAAAAVGAVPGHTFVLADYGRFTAAAALSVVAGFVSLLPGGLLAREWAMSQILAPVYGGALALVIPLVLRIVWLATEMIGALVLYIAHRSAWTSEIRTGPCGVGACESAARAHPPGHVDPTSLIQHPRTEP